MAGDNDSRWGAAAEKECEQYINGFTDALLLAGGVDGVCLPGADSRADRVRRAFTLWVHQHYRERHAPAGEGLLKSMKESFPC